VILPPNFNNDKYKGLPKIPYEEFSSKTKVMGTAEIKNMLEKGKFI
jgi:hypothetical protein